MTVLSPNVATGDQFRLSITNPKHFGPEKTVPNREKSFGQLMFDSLDDVNEKQQNFADLSVRAAIDPNSVDPHDVTIAGAEANMSLNIARNVIDRVIRAYRDLTSLR